MLKRGAHLHPGGNPGQHPAARVNVFTHWLKTIRGLHFAADANAVSTLVVSIVSGALDPGDWLFVLAISGGGVKKHASRRSAGDYHRLSDVTAGGYYLSAQTGRPEPLSVRH